MASDLLAAPLHITTPLLQAPALSQHTGTNIWLKMDALQPVGSFKIRGVGHACQTYVKNGAQRFISSSGGNAGIAAAYAGQSLGVPVVVFVPETTTPQAVKQIEQRGAEVVIVGKSWQEANDTAVGALTATDAFLHPFDDPLLWQGHATLIDEIAATGLKPDAIITAVGGGGLLTGISLGLAQQNWQDTALITAETDGAASFNAALSAGRLVELPGINSVATSLGARQVCQQALDMSQIFNMQPIVVTDEEAISACHQFINEHRILVEPACGAALAVCYASKLNLKQYENVVIEICGGSTITLERLQTLPGW